MMRDSIRKFQYHGQSALRLPAERGAFTLLKEWLSGIAVELGLPDRTRKQLLISADEIFTNIANYGYPSAPGDAMVTVAFDMATETLTIEFTDSGVAYDPLSTPPPEMGGNMGAREIGGLGVFMVKKLMDSVKYRRENDLNILTMTKTIAK